MCVVQCLLVECELGIVSQDKGTHNGGKGTKEHSQHSQSAVRMAGRRKSAGVVAGNRQYTYWRSMTQSHPIVTPHNDHVPVGGMSHIAPHQSCVVGLVGMCGSKQSTIHHTHLLAVVHWQASKPSGGTKHSLGSKTRWVSMNTLCP